MANVNEAYKVALDDDAVGHIDSLIPALTAAGLVIAEVLRGAGVIVGTARPTTVDAIKRVPGVASVTPERRASKSPASATR